MCIKIYLLKHKLNDVGRCGNNFIGFFFQYIHVLQINGAMIILRKGYIRVTANECTCANFYNKCIYLNILYCFTKL